MNIEPRKDHRISRFVSRVLGRPDDHAFVSSTIIQKSPGEIIDALFNYDLIAEIIPKVKELILQDNGNAYLSFQIDAVEIPGCNLSLLKDSPTSIRWDFAHQDGNYKGVIFLDELPGNRGTIVNFISENPIQKESLLRLIKELLANEDEHSLQDGVKRFKALLESGQIPTTVGQPHGNRSQVRN
jgi:hypothetical protein